MNKVIYTIDSRENLELLTIASYFEVSNELISSMIYDFHDLLLEELSSKSIKYEDLKPALIPSKKKKEAALIFDSVEIGGSWYAYDIFDIFLKCLDKKSVTSVLMGDFIERSRISCLPVYLKEVNDKIYVDETHDHFIVYINNLSQTEISFLDNKFKTFRGYRGIADISYESNFKDALSTMLIPAFVKIKDTVILESEYDYVDLILDKKGELSEEPENSSGFPFIENGFKIINVSRDLYGIFLTYKIERDCFGMDEADQFMCLNFLSQLISPLKNCTVNVTPQKLEYLKKSKGDTLRRIGMEDITTCELEEMIHDKINSNYLYNLEINEEHEITKFNIMIELEGNKPYKLVFAFKYEPETNRLHLITCF